MQRAGRVTFLTLPLEMRREVYRHLLHHPAPFVVNYLYYSTVWKRPVGMGKDYYSWLREWTDVKIHTSTLRVSKQVSDEALDVLYGENSYEIRLGGGEDDQNHNFIGRFAPSNQRRIRRLQLHVQPTGLWFRHPIEIDPRIWTPLLANATRIRIIAQQPVLYTGYFDERKVREWLEWLQPVLEFINQHVSGTRSIVQVHDDDRVDTAKVMAACFPSGYRKVHYALIFIWLYYMHLSSSMTLFAPVAPSPYQLFVSSLTGIDRCLA